MKHLLDVDLLMALVWPDHASHHRADQWRQGKMLVTCPIVELGFLRVSSGPAFNATLEDCRTLLQEFLQSEKAGFLPADLPALDGLPAPSSKKTTGWYLANLAQKHGVKLATFDQGISHPAAVLVS